MNEILQVLKINGFLLLNKPPDISSFFALMRIRKLFLDFLLKNNIKPTKQIKSFFPKLGHAGTLDPFAKGLLIVLIGDATRLTDLFQNYNKEYIAKIKLGLKTDTYDIKGNILGTFKTFFDRSDVENIIKFFVGKISQEIPIYSAVSINGKRLYKYAREGRKIDLPKKEIFIETIDLLDFDKDSQVFTIKVKCSKGTYIRALANDIGVGLGTNATLIELERTKIGDFSIEKSKKLNEISDIFDLKKYILSLEKYFSSFYNEKIEKLITKGETAKKVLNGNFNFLQNEKKYYNAKYKLYSNDKILGIVDIDGSGKVKNNFIFRNNLN